MPPRVILFGAGKRALYYRDVLARLQADGALRMAGVWSRTSGRATPLAQALSCPDLASLPEPGRGPAPADLAILSVAHVAKTGLAHRMLEAGMHVLVDTPAADTPAEVRKLREAARSRSLTAEVAEDEAFSPLAQLHRQVAAAGALGTLERVVNQFQEFYYHGTARLSVLLGHALEPMRYRAREMRVSRGARLEYREVDLGGGVSYEQVYTSPKGHPLRESRDWVVLGSTGSLSEREFKPRGAGAGTEAAAPIIGDPASGRIRVEIRGRSFEWSPPLAAPGWSPHHWGIHALLDAQLEAIRSAGSGGSPGRPLLYGLERAEGDIRAWKCMELARWIPGYSIPARILHGALEWKR